MPRMHSSGAHLTLLVVLEQVLGVGAPREVARHVGAVQYMVPQLLAELALRLEGAFLLALPARGAVPQEQQPPLLLGYR